MTAGYMLVALPLLAAGWVEADARYAFIVTAHAALVVWLLQALRTRGHGAIIAVEWLPLFAVPLLYAELPYLMAAVGSSFGDPAIQRWEVALWGTHPARTLAGALSWAPLSEALHLAYFSYYAIIYAPLLWLWRRSRQATGSADVRGNSAATLPHRPFAEAALGVMATFVVCFVVFVVFPVQGPRYLWPAPEGIPGGPMRTLVLAVLERGSSRGAAFPSSHMAVATVQALMVFRWHVPGRLLIALLTAGLGIGAVYGGFHYAVDMIAGALVGAGVFLVIRGGAGRRIVSG